MSVKNILLPMDGSDKRDFAVANNQVGWVRMTRTEPSVLVDIADRIPFDVHQPPIQDHAIPSPIAHIKHFKNQLDSGNEDIINEWRGMLSVIALQKIYGYNISIVDIPLYADGVGNTTNLGNVICDDLVANSNITGYTVNEQGVPNIKNLSVFCKNGKPFAMYMPSMLICPFKKYDIHLFDDVEWYSNTGTIGDSNADPKGTWYDVRPKIIDNETILNSTAKKFYFWLDANGQNQIHVNEFKRHIQGGIEAPRSTTHTVPQPGNYGDNVGNAMPTALKSVCTSPVGDLDAALSKKLLFIIPPAKLAESDTYKICRGGLTPKKFTFTGICNSDEEIIVVPPIHKNLVTNVCDGTITVNDWELKYDPEKEEFTFEIDIKVTETNQLLHRKYIYKPEQVAWIDTMPYISMWPYVKFSDSPWKNNYIAISTIPMKAAEDSESHLSGYERLIKSGKYTRLLGEKSDITKYATCPEIKIDVIPSLRGQTTSRYNVTSGYKKDNFNNKFTMLKSESAPYALEFSYSYADEEFSLGCWVIEGALEISTQNNATSYAVAMDFGTTSTNVYLRSLTGNTEPRSMSHPGKFLHEIYNPYAIDESVRLNASIDSTFLQNYYLFSARGDGPLGKIFTYGQNFDAVEILSNGKKMSVDGTVPNITGRMVVVDDAFLLSDTSESESRIYHGLKMKDPENSRDSEKEIEKATKNFIYDILMYAVLEAKINSATKIDLRMSYPSEKQGGVVLGFAESIKEYLAAVSGCEIEVNCKTEAASAGEFFKNLGDDRIQPTPENGYLIIDIGGGTTDISFWKGNNQEVDLKAEHSFAYAGNYLILRTILQELNDGTNFENMWIRPIDDNNSLVTKAIAKYNSIHLAANPVTTRSTEAYLKKTAVLDFLLEHKESEGYTAVNNNKLSDGAYRNFLSAIRLKYYSLFYLIANYMKKNDNIKFNKEYGFSIHLAGCGSKGIETFAKCNYSQFEANVKRLFCGIAGADRVVWVKPQTENKEEVVKGLAYFDDDQANNDFIGDNDTATQETFEDAATAMFGALDGTDSTEVEETTQTIPSEDTDNVDTDDITATTTNPVTYQPNKPKNGPEALAAYETLLTTLRNLEEKNQLLQRLSCDQKVNPKEFSIAREVFLDTWQLTMARVAEVDYNPNTYAEHFALLMLENMINYLI